MRLPYSKLDEKGNEILQRFYPDISIPPGQSCMSILFFIFINTVFFF